MFTHKPFCIVLGPIATALALAIFSIAGCSSDSDSSTGAAAGSSDAASDAGQDAAIDASSDGSADTGIDGATADAGFDSAADSAPDSPSDSPAIDAEASAPVASCDQIASSVCFANKDCPAEQRCENVGTEDNQVPCCVVGPRGTKGAGETCSSESDCQSGVCVAGNGPALCSTTCSSVADCPTTMQQCTSIAFSGSSDNWCLPTE